MGPDLGTSVEDPPNFQCQKPNARTVGAKLGTSIEESAYFYYDEKPNA
jgi:hypothetical protein